MQLAFEELSRLYNEVEAQIRAHSPVCELSSRCCRFREFGHDLFLTSLEHEFLLASGEPAVSPFSAGENCPWQAESGQCKARAGRPLGCRIFFCDPAWADTMPNVMENAMTTLRQISDRNQLQWDYRPLHKHLLESLAAGRWSQPDLPRREPVGYQISDESSADCSGQSPENRAESGQAAPVGPG